MKKQVKPEIKEARSKRVIELSNKNGEEYNKKYIGKEVEVLVEEEEKNVKYVGHMKNYIKVVLINAEDKNTIVKVKITKVHGYSEIEGTKIDF